MRHVLSTPNPGGLQSLIAQTQRLARLTGQVRACLPSPLDQHVQVARRGHDSLTLVTDASAWSTKLRYLQPMLLDQLRQRYNLALRTIEVRVARSTAADTETETATRATQRRLSADAAALIGSCADCTADPQLQAALKRLASRRRT